MEMIILKKKKKRNAFRVCYRARVENYFKERYWNLKRGKRGEGRKFLEITLENLYSQLRSCWFDDSRQKLQKLLNILALLQIINSVGADEARIEFPMFYQIIAKLKRGDCVSFETEKGRLDDFYFKEVEVS